jgi:ABC-type dipeptide/oligopeptide/nickel transport system permease component
MTTYVAKRLLGAVPTFLGVITVVFIVMRLVPGDPAMLILGEDATVEALQAVRADLGLDRPLVVQYGTYLADVIRGDFGRSLRTNRPVVAEVIRVLPYTATLAIAGTLIGCLIGITAGVISAVRRNTVADYVASAMATVGLALPVFTIGILLLVVFSYNLRWFPVLGAGDTSSLTSVLHHLALPSVAIGMSAAATIARMTRSSVLEVLSLDFVRTARAKGLPSRIVTRRHVLKNAMIPVVTLIGLNFGRLMSGTVITETLFVRPGLGRLLIDSIYSRDYPQVEVTVAVFALIFIVINLVVDLTYAYLDPRIHYA